MTVDRRSFLRVGGAIAAAGTLSAARAQGAWPTRPVTLVVPFPAGGGTDAFARPFTSLLTREFGRQVIIDNRGGAGGNVGATLAARATPDGYTFFMGAVHHAIAPSMYAHLDYSIENDFVPIGLISSVPQVIVVPTRTPPPADLQAFLAKVRSRPGALNYGSAGNGTSHHLAGELFKLQTKTFITHIPYRGSGPALQDLIAGQVDVMFDGLGSSAAHIKSGNIKALAVASAKRAVGFPDLPTAAEAGVPGYEVSTWYGLWAPKGTPKDAMDTMQAAMRKVFASPELKTQWNALGTEVPNLYGDDFRRFVTSEIKRWGDVVKRSGARLE